MLQATMGFVEVILLVTGVLFIAKSMFLYVKRTKDWSGVAVMVIKRVGMDAHEYRCYRFGVSCFVVGVIVRIVNMIFWPQL
jgi:hypothetical protein